MWKALFPRLSVVTSLAGIAVMIFAALIFWIMHVYVPISTSHVFPYAIAIGAGGALILLLSLVDWVRSFLYPLLKLVGSNGWKIGTLKYKREHCDHERYWVYDPENQMIRSCSKCGCEQRRSIKPFTLVGEAKYKWRDQNFDELRLL